MTNNIEISAPLLAFWRHELFAPLNIIQGYSSLIIEELEDLGDSQKTVNPLEVLSSICETSQTLYQNITKVLNTKLLENSECNYTIHDLRYKLELEVSSEIDEIEATTQKAFGQNIPEFISDLEKILTAIHDFRSLLHEDFNWLEGFSSSNNDHYLTSKLLESEESLHQNKSTFKDIKSSLNSIKEDNYHKQHGTKDSHILIIDNNKSNQELLYRQLEREGYCVNTVESGEKAIYLIQERRYDLILLDIIMPGLNGYQVLHYLKQSQWKNIPVIMISSLNEIDSITKCIEMGAEDYLPKPFNFTLLQARIDACLEKKKLRDQERVFIERLALANTKIADLNKQLKAENVRLSAELEITRRMQQLILPRDSELGTIEEVDIAGFMEPAEEVGGDYYDVHQHNGSINISIGDITGHGLESGLLMIMVQTAVRTMIENNVTDPKQLLSTLNRIVIDNVRRIESDKNLTLSLIKYVQGTLSISGQHEEVIVVRSSGQIEHIDTIDLGFPIGLEDEIEQFISQTQLSLNSEDIVVLYTDGVTEAESNSGEQYGIARLDNIICRHRQCSASDLKKIIVDDLRSHIGDNKVLDDFTLLIIKQK